MKMLTVEKLIMKTLVKKLIKNFNNNKVNNKINNNSEANNNHNEVNNDLISTTLILQKDLIDRSKINKEDKSENNNSEINSNKYLNKSLLQSRQNFEETENFYIITIPLFVKNEGAALIMTDESKITKEEMTIVDRILYKSYKVNKK